MPNAPYTLYIHPTNNVIRSLVIDINAAREAAMRNSTHAKPGRAVAEQVAAQIEKYYPKSQARQKEVIDAIESLLKFMNELSAGYFTGLVLRVPGIIEENTPGAGTSTPADVQKQIDKLVQAHNKRFKEQENQYNAQMMHMEKLLDATRQQVTREQINQQQVQGLNKQLMAAEKDLQEAQKQQQEAQKQILEAQSQIKNLTQQLQDAFLQIGQLQPQLQLMKQHFEENEQLLLSRTKERDALLMQHAELETHLASLTQSQQANELQLRNLQTSEKKLRESRDKLKEDNNVLQKQVEEFTLQIDDPAKSKEDPVNGRRRMGW